MREVSTRATSGEPGPVITAGRGGALHPITRMTREIVAAFTPLGFVERETRHIEDDTHNFDLLGFPADHPTRTQSMTFYLRDGGLLRTHGSAGQLRVMPEFAPDPCRVLMPATCYRRQPVTALSSTQFHQIEGLLVEPSARASDLAGLFDLLARAVFGPRTATRLREYDFPFTATGVKAEMDCPACGGARCLTCRDRGWVDLGAGGILTDSVLAHGGYDPGRVAGLAFGISVERLLMYRHALADIRPLSGNDLFVLDQFH